MSALFLFIFLIVAGGFIMFLGSNVHGPVRFLSAIAGVVSLIIGFYGVFTYFL